MDVILVEPKIPENIGFIARIMKNFGFKNLIILKPRCDLEKAYVTATHGKDILDNAKILNKNLKDIRKEYDLLVGTSGKVFENNFRREYITPETLAKNIKLFNKVGIVFGREDIGLTNEEIDVCDVLLHIPTSKEFPILNLSHAVAIVLYVLFRENYKTDKKENIETKFLWKYLDSIVSKLNYRKKHFKESVRKVFYKMVLESNLSKKDFSILMGFLNLIDKSLK